MVLLKQYFYVFLFSKWKNNIPCIASLKFCVNIKHQKLGCWLACKKHIFCHVHLWWRLWQEHISAVNLPLLPLIQEELLSVDWEKVHYVLVNCLLSGLPCSVQVWLHGYILKHIAKLLKSRGLFELLQQYWHTDSDTYHFLWLVYLRWKF